MTLQPSSQPPLRAEHSVPEGASSSLLGDASTLTRELRAMVHAQLELAELETRLAARTVIHMLALAVGIAVLLVGAWLTLVGAAVLALMNQGVSPMLAMLAATAVNLVAAGFVYMSLRRHGESLGWPVTLRMLKPKAAEPKASSKP
ncbi:MAG: phage holin family protein [Gammaproteobacteria bacterium]|nr:phage holin family protein [Gammaproteobacteria bacterium]